MFSLCANDRKEYEPIKLEYSEISISKVFQRGKTTIPSDVRKNLGIKDGDKVIWLFKNGDYKHGLHFFVYKSPAVKTMIDCASGVCKT